MTATDVATLLGLILGSTAVLGIIGRTSLALWRGARRVGQVLDDWQGAPESPGHPARPGVMERLARVEYLAAETAIQLRPNGGSSTYDRVRRMAGPDPTGYDGPAHQPTDERIPS